MCQTVTSINCEEDIDNAGVAFPKKWHYISVRDSLMEIFRAKDLTIPWKINNTV